MASNGSSTEDISSDVKDRLFYISYPFIVLTACWIVFANTLIIIAVFTTVQLQQKMYHVMVSMAAADLLNGLSVCASYYSQGRMTIYNPQLCALLFIPIMCTMVTSMLHVPLITVDRFVAVVYPLHYDIILPPGRLKTLTALAWVMSTLLGLIPFVWYDKAGLGQKCDFRIIPGLYKVLVMGVLWFIIIPFTCVLYIKIGCVAWAQENQLITLANSRQASMQQAVQNDGVSDGVTSTQMTKTKAERKGARVVALALGVFVVCWSPMIWIVFFYGVFTLKGVSVRSLVAYLDPAFALAFANSGMNFVVYALKSAEFRAAFARLLCRRDRARVGPLE